MRHINRRDFLGASASTMAALVFRLREDREEDPWPKGVLMEPATLAALVQRAKHLPHIICVGFPETYKRKHIPHAEFAGPAGTPDGLKAFQAAVARLPKTTPLVLYCGCCPLRICPNAPAAFHLVQKLGFHHVRVLNIVKDFDIDWVRKGYPVASG